MAEKPKQIFLAMAEVMHDIEPIAKECRNQQQNYNYRSIDQIYNACHPLFAKHGIFATSEVIDQKHESRTEQVGRDKVRTITHCVLHMRFSYHAKDGSSVSSDAIGEGIDYNGDKAANKAMSAADKYALLQLLKIPTATMDSDADRKPDDRFANSKGPAVATRGDRVNSGEIKAALAVWKAKNPELSADDWKKWAAKAAGREFNAGATTEWTRADITAVKEALNDG